MAIKLEVPLVLQRMQMSCWLEWFNLKLAKNIPDCMMYMPKIKRH